MINLFTGIMLFVVLPLVLLITPRLYYGLHWHLCAREYDRAHKPHCHCGHKRPQDGSHLYGCSMREYRNPFHGHKWTAEL